MSTRIAIGDAHFSGFQDDILDDQNLPMRLGMIMKSLNFIISYGRSKGIVSYDFLGDLIHDKSIIYTVAQNSFKKFLVENHDLKFYIISGNHDMASTGDNAESAIDVFSEYSNVTCITKPKEIENIYYVPFCENFIDTIKDYNGASKILIAHVGLGEATLQSGLSKVDKVSINDLSTFKLALLGHYHKPQKINNGSTEVWYPGSLISRDWNDKNEQKRFLVYDDDTLEVESVDINGLPQYREFIIDVNSNRDEVLALVKQCKLNGDHVRIQNKTKDKITSDVLDDVLVLESNEIDITNRGINVSQTREEQLKKFLEIKSISENERPEYLSIIEKYNLLSNSGRK